MQSGIEKKIKFRGGKKHPETCEVFQACPAAHPTPLGLAPDGSVGALM